MAPLEEQVLANLRTIKDRITSITNTQKITRAMKMVAAAKVKKAENATKASRPFASDLYKIFARIIEDLGTESFDRIEPERALENYPELLKRREIKTIGLLVITSNKGLAGAYSTNVVRYTIKRIKEALKNGQKVKLFLVGQKAIAPLKNARRNLDYEISQTYTSILDSLDANSAIAVAEDLAEAYVGEEVDSIELITTRYQNMMTYRVENWALLPALGEQGGVQKFREEDKEGHYAHSTTEFEPDVSAIMQKLVPMYVTNIIYQALLEATASELASRMTAMSAAVNNANEMIRVLTIDYNKARQAKITQELNEVISGADALK